MSTYIPHDVMGILVGQLFRCGSSSRKVWKFRYPRKFRIGRVDQCLHLYFAYRRYFWQRNRNRNSGLAKVGHDTSRLPNFYQTIPMLPLFQQGWHHFGLVPSCRHYYITVLPLCSWLPHVFCLDVCGCWVCHCHSSCLGSYSYL